MHKDEVEKVLAARRNAEEVKLLAVLRAQQINVNEVEIQGKSLRELLKVSSPDAILALRTAFESGVVNKENFKERISQILPGETKAKEPSPPREEAQVSAKPAATKEVDNIRLPGERDSETIARLQKAVDAKKIDVINYIRSLLGNVDLWKGTGGMLSGVKVIQGGEEKGKVDPGIGEMIDAARETAAPKYLPDHLQIFNKLVEISNKKLKEASESGGFLSVFTGYKPEKKVEEFYKHINQLNTLFGITNRDVPDPTQKIIILSKAVGTRDRIGTLDAEKQEIGKDLGITEAPKPGAP